MPLSWTVATTLYLGCKNEGFPLNYIWTNSKITVRSGIVGKRFGRCGSAFLYMKGNDPDSPAELNPRRNSCWSVTSFVRLQELLNQTQGLEKLPESPGSQPCADVNVLPGPTLGGGSVRSSSFPRQTKELTSFPLPPSLTATVTPDPDLVPERQQH